jgi:hypothetical protein
MMFLLVKNICQYLAMMSLLDTIIVRYLVIVIWKRPPPFEETFVWLYIRLTNYLMVLMFLVLDVHSWEFNVALGRYLGRQRFPEEMEGLIPFR